MTLTDSDKIWRDQNFPDMSDKDFDKIVQTFGGNPFNYNCKVDKDDNNTNQSITYEDWHNTLVEKYDKLGNTINENLPNIWDSLDFELSIQKILNIKDCTLPFAGILLGKPSSLKTVGLGLFRKWKQSFYTDNFSPKSFVSHSTAVKKEELTKIDLLPKIKDKFFLTPELSSVFTKKDEDLIELLGILTRVLDGQGYESDTGAHGHRGYNFDIMFTWVGVAVDIPYRVHKILGTLGAKLYFLRLPTLDKGENDYLEQVNKDDFITKIKLIQDALIDYLDYFEKCPNGIKENNLMKIPWDFQKDDEKTKRLIVRLGILLAHLRGTVPTWETRDSQGIDYAYTFANVEEPDRAIRQLINLARGHALSQGRNYITIKDLGLIINVVFSTASMERVRIFELLLNFGGSLTTRQITDYLNTSANTAKRTMAELRAIGLVQVETIEGDHGGEPMKRILLDDKFEWFLSDEFRELQHNSHCKKFSPLLNIDSTIQNCIVQEEIQGGIFSYSENPNIMYSKNLIHNSVIPRTEDKKQEPEIKEDKDLEYRDTVPAWGSD